MIELRPGRREDAGDLAALCETVFRDDPAYLSGFYGQCFEPEHTVVLRDASGLAAMCHLLPARLVTSDGQRWEVPYLYALCTRPDARGLGYAGAVLDYVDFRLPARGSAGVALVPAEPSLHGFFARHGYREAFSAREWDCAPDGLTPGPVPQPISPEDYLAARERLLSGTAHLAPGLPYARAQALACAVSGGGLYRVGAALAAVELAPGGALVKELLCPPGEEPAALGSLAAQWPGRALRVRGPGTDRPLGMARWYLKHLEGVQAAHLGFALD